jgi:hypothetical protein
MIHHRIRHTVFAELGVVGDNRKAVQLRLRNNEAVEKISGVKGKLPEAVDVRRLDR